MGPSDDIDDLLERYLEEATVESVTKNECKEKHKELEDEVEKAIKEAVSKSATGLKLWAVGALLGAVIAVLAGYTCSMTEVGAYRERIDNNTRQLEKLERGQERLLQMLMERRGGAP